MQREDVTEGLVLVSLDVCWCLCVPDRNSGAEEHIPYCFALIPLVKALDFSKLWAPLAALMLVKFE